jgi:ribosomal protein S12 methylthiotransferase accessory factor
MPMTASAEVCRPVRIGDRHYRAPKCMRDESGGAAGSRSVPAAETLARVRPVLAKAGVTRLADITGLDRIGVPVAIAVRPNSRTLSTNAGKGLTMEAAFVSAAMEAIEVFHAETLSPDLRRISQRDLPPALARIDPALLPIRKHAAFNVQWPCDWVLGWDLIGEVETAVPFQLVALGARRSSYDFPVFQASSNGLASGNHILEAILASLLEVIERDAVTCYRFRHSGDPLKAVEPARLRCPQLDRVCGRLAETGIAATLIDCTGDAGIPVFQAYLHDLRAPGFGVYRGSAADLDSGIACLRALLEAIQSRAVYAAGSRDDYFQEELRLFRHPRHTRDMEALTAGAQPAEPSRGLAPTASLEGDIALVIEALQRAGAGQIVAFDLSRPEFPVYVAKVVVPGFEGYPAEDFCAGPRALRNREGAP